MHNLIIWLLTAITFAPLHGMENTQYQWQELPPELLTKIIACSELTEKDTLRQTCKAFHHISSIKNWDIYTHTPLVLSHNKTKDIVLLMADQKEEISINNLLSHNIDFSNEPFEFYLQLSKNYPHIAERIIQRSTIDINTSTLSYANHLYIAAEKGEIKTVQLLCKHPKNNINHLFRNRFTPLFIAARNGHLGVVQFLANNTDCILDGLDPEGATPLYIACQQGHNDVVQFLLTQNVSVKKTFKGQLSCLYAAARNGHVSVIKSLLNCTDALINSADNDGATPLFAAAEYGHAKAVKVLCKHGANRNSLFLNSYPPLYVAAQNGHTEIVKTLLSYPDNLINYITSKNSTTLSIAAFNGHTEIVELLLKHQDIDTTITWGGHSALYMATKKNHHKIMQLLLTHSPNLINVCTQKQFSSLHCSVSKNDLEGINILLATPGIYPNIINNDDKTPLDIAYENTNKTIIELLISKGAITADQTKNSNDSR